MAETIMNGGPGPITQAHVDENHRLHVHAVEEKAEIDAVKSGELFTVSSGYIDLTNDSENAVMFIENAEDADIIITELILNALDSTGGSLPMFDLKLYKDGSGLTSGAGSAIDQANHNLGDKASLSLISDKGAVGASVTGGTAFMARKIENPTTSVTVSVNLLLPKGASLGITVQAPSSNTSMSTQVEAIVRFA